MTDFLPLPGTAYEDLETPRLVIDLAAMEHNIETLHRFFRGRPARVRRVTKGHKCPAIAQRQMRVDGAVPFGLSCAKVSEAEVMVAAGARHIRVGGNLGTPALDLTPVPGEGTVVLELSSYQLDLTVEATFDIGVLLNVARQIR